METLLNTSASLFYGHQVHKEVANVANSRRLHSGAPLARVLFTFLFVVSLLVCSNVVRSQPRMPGPGMEGRMERLQQFKKLRLIEVLNLNEEESIKFFARYNKFEEELRDLEQQRNGILDNLETLIRREEKEEAYKKDFDDLLALGQKLSDARVRFYNDARGMLTPKQVAKLLVFERNFNRDLREMIQDVQRERRREPYRR